MPLIARFDTALETKHYILTLVGEQSENGAGVGALRGSLAVKTLKGAMLALEVRGHWSAITNGNVIFRAIVTTADSMRRVVEACDTSRFLTLLCDLYKPANPHHVNFLVLSGVSVHELDDVSTKINNYRIHWQHAHGESGELYDLMQHVLGYTTA